MPVSAEKIPLIGVIDAGTRTVEFVVFRSQHTDELLSHEVDVTQLTPQEGWLEQDPKEILRAIDVCVKAVAEQLSTKGYKISDIATIGITNQRETTIVWDKTTGEPLYNAIVWNDIRTESTVDKILGKLPDNNKNHFKPLCGLPVSPYFSALKLKWLKDNVKIVRKAYKEKRLMFGTVDTWILWNLTGGTGGGIHITDVTNASRTLLMNIETLNWDPLLCRTFSINEDILPEIRSSSEIYGRINCGSCLDGLPISGILGNQQSALVGQRCLKPGQAKNTYRSGCFLIYNTGTTKVQSSHGLVTTVAYQLGNSAPVYALEGSVAVAGAALKWLRDNMGMVKDVVKDTEELALEVFSTGDVYFVPAFKGLFAPYWRMDARGILCGLTAFTTKGHIIRAALESVCFQTRDILEAMHKDCGFSLSKLYVDGKMTQNNLLMQLQADISGIPVFRAQSQDITALGVAMAAGQAKGINVWDINAENHETVSIDTFLPTTTDEERDARYTKWKMAVQRSLGWVTTKKSVAMTERLLPRPYSCELDCINARRLSGIKNIEVKYTPLVSKYKPNMQEDIQVESCEFLPPFWWEHDKKILQKINPCEKEHILPEKEKKIEVLRWRPELNVVGMKKRTVCQRRDEMLQVGQPFRHEACTFYYENYPAAKLKIFPFRFSI